MGNRVFFLEFLVFKLGCEVLTIHALTFFATPPSARWLCPVHSPYFATISLKEFEIIPMFQSTCRIIQNL